MSTLYETDDEQSDTSSNASCDNANNKSNKSKLLTKFAKFFCLNSEDDKAELQINRAPQHRSGGRTTG